jgi:hypothetical protein
MSDYELFFAHQKALNTFDGKLNKHPFFVPYLGLNRGDQVLNLMIGEGEDILCTLIVFYYIDRNRRFCMRMERINPAVFLTKKEEYSVFKFLLEELEELCATSGAHYLEVEVLHEIKSNIFFPSTEFLFDSFNTSLLEDVERFGFQKSFARATYVMSSCCGGTFSHVRKMKINLYEERFHYYSLLSLLKCAPDYFNPRIKAHFWLSDYSRLFDLENVYFFETDHIKGLAHWMPNLYRIKRRDLYIGKEDGSELQTFGEAKVFRIAGDTLKTRTTLLDYTIEKVKSQGCNTLQVGNIMQNDPLVNVLLDKNATKAFETTTFRCFEEDNNEE